MYLSKAKYLIRPGEGWIHNQSSTQWGNYRLRRLAASSAEERRVNGVLHTKIVLPLKATERFRDNPVPTTIVFVPKSAPEIFIDNHPSFELSIHKPNIGPVVHEVASSIWRKSSQNLNCVHLSNNLGRKHEFLCRFLAWFGSKLCLS